jgi:putative cardiolipin synthase
MVLRMFPVLVLALLSACATSSRQTSTQPTAVPDHSGVARAQKSLPHQSAPAGVRMVHRNDDAWLERWRMVSNARHSIDMTYFIIQPDVFGRAWMGLLLRKARQGVRIRFMVDGRGTASIPGPFLDRADVHALALLPNVDARIYGPLTVSVLRGMLTADVKQFAASNHDKLIIVDGQTTMLGGRNISKSYFTAPTDDPPAYIDLDVVLHGATTAAQARRTFEMEFHSSAAFRVQLDGIGWRNPTDELLAAASAMDDWLNTPPRATSLNVLEQGRQLAQRAAGRVGALTPRAREQLEEMCQELAGYRWLQGSNVDPARVSRPTTTASATVVDTQSLLLARPHNEITPGFSALLASAQSDVMIVNPYLVLDAADLQDLVDAGTRGVRITVFTNSPDSTDNLLPQVFFLGVWQRLLQKVPNLTLHVAGKGPSLHSKLAVFDGKVTFVGSYNLDALSRLINGEISAVITSEAVAQENLMHIQARLKRGEPAVYTYGVVRDARGHAVLDAQGHATFVGGPEAHCSRITLLRLRFMLGALGLLRFHDLLSPLVF